MRIVTQVSDVANGPLVSVNLSFFFTKMSIIIPFVKFVYFAVHCVAESLNLNPRPTADREWMWNYGM